VTEVAFGGAASTVTVSLSGGAGAARPPLALRCPSVEPPPVGARVRIVATGRAHVF
jgi:hypothetical protein